MIQQEKKKTVFQIKRILKQLQAIISQQNQKFIEETEYRHLFFYREYFTIFKKIRQIIWKKGIEFFQQYPLISSKLDKIQPLRQIYSLFELFENKPLQILKKIDLLFCYAVLLQLINSQTTIQTTFLSFIQSLLLQIKPILRFFLIYFQYYRCSNSQLSQNQSEKQIQIQLIQQLSQYYLKTQKQQWQVFVNQRIKYVFILFRSFQTHSYLQNCRICSAEVPLKKIQKHVRNCQKIFQFKQQLFQNDLDWKRLMMEARTQLHALLQLSQRNVEQLKRLQIFKLLLSPGANENRKLVPRISLMTKLNETHFINNAKKIQVKINAYLKTYDPYPLFNSLLQNRRQKERIQKQLIIIQNLKQHPKDEIVETEYKKKPKKRSSLQQMDLNNLEHCCKKQNENQFNQNEHFSQKKILISQSLVDVLCQNESEKQTFSSTVSLPSQHLPIEKDSQQKFYGESDQQVTAQKWHSAPAFGKTQNQKKILMNHFEILKFIGAGAFGKVYLARRKKTKDIYALKIVQISNCFDQKQLLNVKNQHQVLQKIGGDHLIKALFSFSQKQVHVFILQYLPGGDLGKILQQQVYLSQQIACFYLAQIILAIEYLHDSKIIHRDLKPENVVFDKDGHIKLTDFGLSQIQIKNKLQKTMERKGLETRKGRRRVALSGRNKKPKIIGTPDYIAPQIINELSINNYTIDWWSLGVIAYELIIGVRPFCGDTIQQIIDNIANFKIQWPEIGTDQGMISEEAYDLIKKLLNTDFTKRLGSQGAAQIKSHPFFNKIDWQKIKKTTSPYANKMKKDYDFENLKENLALKVEIEGFLGKGKIKNSLGNRIFKLQQFVRFDILGKQTIENAQYSQQQNKELIRILKLLKNYA